VWQWLMADCHELWQKAFQNESLTGIWCKWDSKSVGFWVCKKLLESNKIRTRIQTPSHPYNRHTSHNDTVHTTTQFGPALSRVPWHTSDTPVYTRDTPVFVTWQVSMRVKMSDIWVIWRDTHLFDWHVWTQVFRVVDVYRTHYHH